MKKLQRDELLDRLNMVKPGLATREFIEQSSCFAFKGGWVYTFNDEIACRIKLNIGVEGAVQANKLLAILERIGDKELDVTENKKGELAFRGRHKSFAFNRDAEIHLSYTKVSKPTDWHPVSKQFLEAIGNVVQCASTDESQFNYTCIHVTPTYVEACDNYQALRVRMKNSHLEEGFMSRATSLAHLPSLGVTEMSVSQDWVHFRNAQGLVFSCRMFKDDYPDITHLYKVQGDPITLTESVKEACETAEVMSADRTGDDSLLVRLGRNRIRIVGEGLSGWYREDRPVTYDGAELEFYIKPKLLVFIVGKYSDAMVGENRLLASSKSWRYVTALSPGRPGEVAEG